MTKILRPTLVDTMAPRKPEDETGADGEANGDAGGKRTQKAKHELLTASGEVTKDMAEAAGIRYTDIATGEVFAIQLGELNPAAVTMLAIFGAKTLATNEASQVRQATARADDVDGTEVDGILDRFEMLKGETPVWREPGEGRVGAKIDRDALAGAIMDFGGKWATENGIAAVRQRLDDDLKYFRTARKSEDVTRLYNARTGKQPVKVDASDL